MCTPPGIISKLSFMKKLGIVWSIGVNVVFLYFILGILSAASTKFEHLVLVAFVLIYLAVWGFYSQWGMSQMTIANAIDNEFAEIRRLLNDWKNIDDYTDEALKDVKQAREKVQKEFKTKFYINAGFQFLFLIIAIFNLILALNQ